jgi:TolB-like protein/tetratricopeptide (TPR) repeat protein
MSSARAGPAAAPEQIRAALERVLESPSFANSLKAQRLLRFVVEETLAGRGDGLKESVIAVSVFARDPSFDPRSDSVVRVEARNLRVRLNEYYMNDGRQDALFIELPKGAYLPCFRPGSSAPPAAVKSRVVSGPAFAGAAAVALLMAGFGVWTLVSRGPAATAPAGVAVLPFHSPAGAVLDYVADGFAEDLVDELGRIPDLRVAAKASSFRFRGREGELREIGRQLNVPAVLRGDLRLGAGRLSVSAQLISTASGERLWSGSFDGEVTEARSLAVAIRQGVASHFRLPSGPAAPAAQEPAPEARTAYWQGRYAISKKQDRREAARCYRRAVDTDPRFAAAWGALAITRALMAFHWEGPVDQMATEARTAAQQAIALDPAAAQEAYLARAVLAYSYDRNWPAAEAAFRQVFEGNPNWAYAHRSYALALVSRGAFDQAFLALDRAARIDPLSVVTSNEEAVALLCSRRFEDAIRKAQTRAALAPDSADAHLIWAMALSGQGRHAEAVAEFEKALARAGRQPSLLGRMGYALARDGKRAEAQGLIDEIQRTSPLPASAVEVAMIHTGLGDPARALALLRQAADAHVTDAVFAGVEPMFDSLRSDPGYGAVRALLALP